MNDKTLTAWAIPGCKPELMPKKIIEIKPLDYLYATCEHLQLNLDDVIKKGRKRKRVYARYLCCYLWSLHTNITLNEMVNLLGGALGDHTTALRGRNQIIGQISKPINNERVINDLNCIMELAKNQIV